MESPTAAFMMIRRSWPDQMLMDCVLRRALQAAQQDLERQRITDSLKKNLANRPEKDDLIGRKSPHSRHP